MQGRDRLQFTDNWEILVLDNRVIQNEWLLKTKIYGYYTEKFPHPDFPPRKPDGSLYNMFNFKYNPVEGVDYVFATYSEEVWGPTRKGPKPIRPNSGIILPEVSPAWRGETPRSMHEMDRFVYPIFNMPDGSVDYESLAFALFKSVPYARGIYRDYKGYPDLPYLRAAGDYLYKRDGHTDQPFVVHANAMIYLMYRVNFAETLFPKYLIPAFLIFDDVKAWCNSYPGPIVEGSIITVNSKFSNFGEVQRDLNQRYLIKCGIYAGVANCQIRGPFGANEVRVLTEQFPIHRDFLCHYVGTVCQPKTKIDICGYFY